mmetsp:Transcript_5835/g.9065  ORF Transcript_5835/g.9065 Transcript_5835/m.9065 type:complete len:181 (+) Transcript_5835:94-636(+)
MLGVCVGRALRGGRRLTLVGRRGFADAPVANATANAGRAPMTSDLVVRVTFVDSYDKRHTVSGLVGMNLSEVCAYNDLPILEDDAAGAGPDYQVVHNERWTEDTFGVGCNSFETHCWIPSDYLDKVPPPTPDETTILEKLVNTGRAEYSVNSRIATEIKLTPELDGMVVHVPDPYPWEVL